MDIRRPAHEGHREARPNAGGGPGRWRGAGRVGEGARRKRDGRRHDSQRPRTGRRCRHRSRCPELFTVERYPNVWQMTSLVKARIARSARRDLRGPASLGVGDRRPKGANDGTARGPGVGAARHLHRRGRPRAARRSGSLQRRDSNGGDRPADAGTLSFGIGSGIVWDSEAGAEYAECLLKGRGARQAARRVRTARDAAVDPRTRVTTCSTGTSRRLRESAEYFGVPIRRGGGATPTLDRAVAGADAPMRVRLLVDSDGARPTKSTDRTCRRRARAESHSPPIRSMPSDVFLFHKTTNRGVYDARAHGSRRVRRGAAVEPDAARSPRRRPRTSWRRSMASA